MEGENHISERDDVVIRFSGDSGDGMQMTGKLFTDTAALMGNGISTFPDFPAEIRAPQGTVSGVSGFQVHIGDHPVSTPGDYCDVLVAMNPAALRANARWLKPGATIICDGDTFNDRSVERAGFRTFDPVTEMNLQDYNVVFPHMTSMTREAVATVGLDPKAASKCKNMFALGICFCIYNRPLDHAVDFIRRKFAKKPAVAEANVLALKGGYNYASNTHAFANTYVVRPAPLPAGLYRSISGNQATAWGLMAASEKRPAAFLRLVSDHAGYGYSRGIGQAEGSERQDASGRGRDIGHLHGHRSRICRQFRRDDDFRTGPVA